MAIDTSKLKAAASESSLIDSLKPLGISIKEVPYGGYEITAPGGTRATKSLPPSELKEFYLSLRSLIQTNNTTDNAKGLSRSARIFGTSDKVRMERAVRFGEAVVEISKEYGTAFAADLLGKLMKPSIESQIPMKGGK